MPNGPTSFLADRNAAAPVFLTPASCVNTIVMVAATAVNLALPVGTTRLRIKTSTGPIFFSYGASTAIVVPVASVTDGTGLNMLSAGEVGSFVVAQTDKAFLNLVTAGTPIVTVECWSGS